MNEKHKHLWTNKNQRKQVGQTLLNDKEWRQNHKEGIDDFHNDPNKHQQWLDNLNAVTDTVARKRWKPIITPDGVFPNRAEAAKYYSITISTFLIDSLTFVRLVNATADLYNSVDVANKTLLLPCLAQTQLSNIVPFSIILWCIRYARYLPC